MSAFLSRKDGAHLQTGKSGEDVACKYLEKKGYRVLCRNWRNKQLEIDLICQHRETIVFVEVKTRKSAERGAPAQAVTKAKQKKLIRAASLYLSDEGAWDAPCRFDVVGVVVQPDMRFEVNHVENAFQAESSTRSRNSGWLPW